MINEFNEKYDLNIQIKQDSNYVKLLPTASKFLFTILNIF